VAALPVQLLTTAERGQPDGRTAARCNNAPVTPRCNTTHQLRHAATIGREAKCRPLNGDRAGLPMGDGNDSVWPPVLCDMHACMHAGLERMNARTQTRHAQHMAPGRLDRRLGKRWQVAMDATDNVQHATDNIDATDHRRHSARCNIRVLQHAGIAAAALRHGMACRRWRARPT
jgi:hypothetical protein